MRRHFSPELAGYCRELGIRTVATAIPALQHAGHRPDAIHRTLWRLEEAGERNLASLRIDGRWFEALTGRSAIG